LNQTPDQIVKWAEGKADAAKPQGKAAHLTPEQKQAIRVAYLETGGNVTYADMGRRCAAVIGREVNRETVAACLKGPEYDALRKHFDSEVKASAVERLKAGILPAADAWVKAIDVAADKGDHKPAKELLMHTGTIEPLDDNGRANGPLVLMAVDFGALGRGHVVDPLTGRARYYTDEETETLRRHGGHSMTVQIGCDPSRIKLTPDPPALPDVPMYRVAGTDELITSEEAARRGEKQDVMTIGVQLPGIG
jgi:hypothetical protein